MPEGLVRNFIAPWMVNVPCVYPVDDQDPKASGVRRKKARFEELMTKWLGMTASAIDTDLSSITPELPQFIMECWTQQYGWGAIVEKNGKYHFCSGIDAGFLGEWTEYYMPKGVIVSNPYAQEFNGQYIFGKNAVLLKNDTNMQGLVPLMLPLAEMQIEANVSMLQALENLRIVNIFHTKGGRMKEAVLSFMKQIRWGRGGFIEDSDSKVRWSGSADNPVIEALPHAGVPSNYVIQFIEASQYVRATLYNEIGLQANGNLKREKLNDSEVSQNDDTLRPIIDNMLECRKDFVSELNRVFGLNIPEPELAGAWKNRQEQTLAEEEGEEDDSNLEGSDSVYSGDSSGVGSSESNTTVDESSD